MMKRKTQKAVIVNMKVNKVVGFGEIYDLPAAKRKKKYFPYNDKKFQIYKLKKVI